MGVSTSLHRLADFTERLETTPNEILALTPRSAEGDLSVDGLTVDLTLGLAGRDAMDGHPGIELRAADARLNDDGTVSVALTVHVEGDESTGETDESTDRETGTDERPAVVEQSVPMGVRPVPEPDPGSASDDTGVADVAGTTESPEAPESGAPAYRDPARLREVYDSDRTFAEMTDALGVDVTPQTVRKYMIDHGIHDPRTNRGTKASTDADVDTSGETTPETDEDAVPHTEPAVVRSDETEPEEPGESEDVGPGIGEAGESEPDGTDPGSGVIEEAGVADSSGTGETDESASDAGTSEPPDEAPSDDVTGLERADDLDEDAGLSADADVDLPAGVTLTQVTDAVRTAKTLFDVQRELGVERARTRTLLADLDLLDLVHGRISTTPDRPRSREEIERRIESAVADAGSSESN